MAGKIKTPEEGFKVLAAAIIVRNVKNRKFLASQWFQDLKAFTDHEGQEVKHIPSKTEISGVVPMPQKKPGKKELEKIQERKEAREMVLGNPMISEFMEFIW